MTALSLVGVGQKITAALMNALIGGANGQGLTLLNPTSVTGTGNTVTANGTVTIGTGANVGINGVFQSAYPYHRVVIQGPGANAFTLQLAASGTADSTANYDLQVLQGSGVTASASQTLAGTSWAISPASAWNVVTLDVFNAAASKPTIMDGLNLGTPSPMAAGTVSRRLSLLHRTASAFDGLLLTVTSGASGCTVQVYGYNPN